MRIGFVGLGKMGTPMCLNLLKAGFPVIVYNRTPVRTNKLVAAGADAAPSLHELAQRTDIVLACLGTVGASEEVFLGHEGLLPYSRPGQVFVDHSTIAPRTAHQIAQAAAGRGATFLDAPISGGPEGAAAAALTIMVGGDPATYSVVEPVLLAMGKRVQRVGDIGAGSVAKLVNQALTAIHAAAAAEAMTLGAKAGAEPVVLLDILKVSFGQSRMLERSAARFLARDFSEATHLKRLAQDLSLIRELSQDLALQLPLTRAALALCQDALDMGLGEADIAALVLPFEREAGIEVVAHVPGQAPPAVQSTSERVQTRRTT